MRAALVVALVLLGIIPAHADRRCTAADVRRFEMIFGVTPGAFKSDPRFQVTLHYLGTVVSKNGICQVLIRPAG